MDREVTDETRLEELTREAAEAGGYFLLRRDDARIVIAAIDITEDHIAVHPDARELRSNLRAFLGEIDTIDDEEDLYGEDS